LHLQIVAKQEQQLWTPAVFDIDDDVFQVPFHIKRHKLFDFERLLSWKRLFPLFAQKISQLCENRSFGLAQGRYLSTLEMLEGVNASPQCSIPVFQSVKAC
jgi:hypothetical protein